MLKTHLRLNGLGGKELVEVAARSINAANQGRLESLIPLPKGVDYQGRSVLPVRDVIAIFHLDQFINGGYEEYYA